MGSSHSHGEYDQPHTRAVPDPDSDLTIGMPLLSPFSGLGPAWNPQQSDLPPLLPVKKSDAQKRQTKVTPTDVSLPMATLICTDKALTRP
jgi:hypothetical protein